MAKPIIRIHDLATDEIIDREMTDAEYKDYLAEQKVIADREQTKLQNEAAKNDLLNRLGITEDEAKLLLS